VLGLADEGAADRAGVGVGTGRPGDLRRDRPGRRITLLPGDAQETLSGLDTSPGLVLLDGWKDLCLPVLRLLEPSLAPGTLVIADDIDLDEL
jgi:predicted O-methyltransferase YrrM